MTPEEFIKSLERQAPAAAYLFLGPEPLIRSRCKEALIGKVLSPEERADGVTRWDLDEVDFATVLDDARSFSLFAANRVIWVTAAEGALPKRMTAAADDEADGGGGKDGSAAELASYLKSPTPGTVLVFDSSRFDFEGDDKAKLQRVQKFYSVIPAQVEFPRFTPQQARRMAVQLAKETKLKIADSQLDLLVDVLGADASRIAQEIEKLALYATNRAVTDEDIWNLVPNAKTSTIFAMVSAIGRRDRTASLDSLDTLVREGEYLPLALTFLATQFRLALVARENNWTSVGQIQAQFSRVGTPMWRSRAEQVEQTVSAFSADKLRSALRRIAETDKALRDTRPDDRTVMEQFVLSLT